MPDDFNINLFCSDKIFFDQSLNNKIQVISDQKDNQQTKTYVDTQSVYSSSSNQEVDIVDLYKKKIQMSILLKQQNINAIRNIFIVSFLIIILIEAVLIFSQTKLSFFLFNGDYSSQVVEFNNIQIEILSFYIILKNNKILLTENDPSMFQDIDYNDFKTRLEGISQVFDVDLLNFSFDNMKTYSQLSYDFSKYILLSTDYYNRDDDFFNSSLLGLLKLQLSNIENNLIHDPEILDFQPFFTNIDIICEQIFNLLSITNNEIDVNYDKIVNYQLFMTILGICLFLVFNILTYIYSLRELNKSNFIFILFSKISMDQKIFYKNYFMSLINKFKNIDQIDIPVIIDSMNMNKDSKKKKQSIK